MAWGALRPNGNIPSRPSVFVIESSTLRAPQSKQAKVPPEPPWARPPKLGGLGWIWALGKTAHFAGTEALPPVIPHTGTKLGALAQRKGLGCRVAEPNTHTRTGSKTKGKKHAQLIPCWLRKLNQWKCL